MDNETSQMFTQLLAALQRKQALSDVEIKQLRTDAATRVESEPEREPIQFSQNEGCGGSRSLFGR